MSPLQGSCRVTLLARPIMCVGTAAAHIVIQKYYLRLAADGEGMRRGGNIDDDGQIDAMKLP